MTRLSCAGTESKNQRLSFPSCVDKTRMAVLKRPYGHNMGQYCLLIIVTVIRDEWKGKTGSFGNVSLCRRVYVWGPQ